MSMSIGGSALATDLARWVEQRATDVATRAVDRTEIVRRIRDVLDEPELTASETCVVDDAKGRVGGEEVRTLVEQRIARALAVGLGMVVAGGSAPAIPAVVAAPADAGPGSLAVTERVADLGATLTIHGTDEATALVEGLLVVGDEDEVRTLAGDAAIDQVRRAMPVELLPSSGVDRILAEMRARLESAGVALDTAPASDDDMIGRVLGDQYLLVERLGKGGFGTVYKATDQMLGHQVAVKMLRPEHRTNEKLVREFVDEAKRLFSLEHENIGGWKTFNRTEEGEVYFVLELLQGEELEDVLRRETALDPDRAGRILLQVLRALDRAHHLSETESLLHLDLKPQNVFVNADESTGTDRVKVIDFGIGQIVRHDAEEDELRIAGLSVDYASPEQCAYLLPGQPRVRLDGRADLFSLGVLAFRMLTGELPHGGDLPNDVADEYRDSDGRLHPRLVRPLIRTHVPCRSVASTGAKVPKPLAHFVDRCLALDRDERFPDSRAALADLERIVDPGVVQRFGVAAAAVLVAVVLGAVGLTKALSDPAGRQVAVLDVERSGANLTDAGLVLGSARSRARIRPEDASVLGSAARTRLVALDSAVPKAWLAGIELEAATDDRAIELSVGAQCPAGHYDCRIDFGGGVRSMPFTLHVVGRSDWEVGAPRFTALPGSGWIDPRGAELLLPLDVDLAAIDPELFEVEASIGDGTTVKDLRLRYDSTQRGFVADVPAISLFGTGEVRARVRHPATAAAEVRAGFDFDTRPLSVARLEVRLADGSELGAVTGEVPLDRPSFLVVESNRPARLASVKIQDQQGWRELAADDVQSDDQRRRWVSLEGVTRGDNDHAVTFVVTLADDPERIRKGPLAPEADGTDEARLSVVAVRSELAFTVTPSDGRTPQDPLRTSAATLELGLEKTSSQNAVFEGMLQYFGPGELPGALDDATAEPLERFELPALAPARRIEVPLTSGEGWYRVRYRGRSAVGASLDAEAVELATAARSVERYVVLDTTAPALEIAAEDRSLVVVGAEGATAIADALGRIRIDETPKLGAGTSPLGVEFDVLRGGTREALAPRRVVTLADGATLTELAADVGGVVETGGDGRYVLEMCAIDAAGNRGATEAVVVDLATRGPRVEIRFPEAGTRPRWEPVDGSWPLPLRVEDPNGIASVQYAIAPIDSSEQPHWIDVELPNAELYPQTLDTTKKVPFREYFGLALSDRAVVVSVRAIDRYDNATVERKERNVPPYRETRRRELSPLDSSASRMLLVQGNATDRYAFSGSSSIEEERAAFDRVSAVDVDSFPDADTDERWNRFVYDKGEIGDFYMDEHEVTNGQFLDFVEASSGYLAAHNWVEGAAPDAARHAQLAERLASADARTPVHSVTWYEAAAYARWVGKRLPTLVEFEYAVRDGASYRTWSGDGGPSPLTTDVVNFGGVRTGPWRVGQGEDVTVEGACTSAGIRDLAANLREWTSSPAWVDGRSVWKLGRVEQIERIVHGGGADGLAVGDLRFCAGSDHGWTTADFCTVDTLEMDEAAPFVGFRCVVDRAVAESLDGARFRLAGETLYD